jgi:hypothetical protein
MRDLDSFDYAIIRVVPHVDRGERINVGVVLFSRTRGYLAVRVEPDWDRLKALAPDLDTDEARRQLQHLVDVGRAEPDGGPIARLSASERYHWLVSPRSTVIQVSEAHSGLCSDPDMMLEHLIDTMVRTPRDES